MLSILLVLLQSSGPVEFARQELARAGKADVPITVTGQGVAESFRVRVREGAAQVDGADACGAMYGALELAERLRQGRLQEGEFGGTPWLVDRGLNLFLTLPWDYARQKSDHDPAALGDPARWWFHDDDYWRTLLDQMARSRLNWLDLHGTWDIEVTDAPNLYAYFIHSESYPEVGVRKELKHKNLERLRQVIRMAHDRGVRVSLMAYEARLRTPHQPRPPYPDTEAVAFAYTREVVEAMIRQVPELDGIGFRIGESGRSENFFRCYQEAIAHSGRELRLFTRSWITRKQAVLPLARAARDFTVEIKYNGEQWGPPYLVAGGRVPNWYSYSFEDYLSDSGEAKAATLWPGNPTRDGERWPDQPYRIVWQVRANGTHRIFPFYSPDHVRRSVRAMKIGTASGFTVEPLDAYYPASPRGYVADSKDLPCPWVHERDEQFLLQWGRLGYDPETQDAVFEQALAERFGKSVAPALAKAWDAASRIVPLAFTAYSLGPDHRNHAPELEWGGDTRAFLDGQPFDSHVFAPLNETLANTVCGGKDGRRTLIDAAQQLERLAAVAVQVRNLNEADASAFARARLHELRVACVMLSWLGEYYAARFRSALWAGGAEQEILPRSVGCLFLDCLGCSTQEMERALVAWQKLSDWPEAAFYRPFPERLRMGSTEFHWRKELPKVDAEANRLRARAPSVVTQLSYGLRNVVDARLSWQREGDRLTATVAGLGVQSAWLLHKPLASSTYFHKVAMTAQDQRFIATVPAVSCGLLLAAEVEVGSQVTRIPTPENGAPYVVVPARPGPTPQYYSSQEAMRFLDPKSLDPDQHGLLLLGTRAMDFHRRFDARTQRKLLDPVERGMTLLVLQQDWLSGRYPMAWLPQPPKVESHRTRVFDPAGALGLPRIEADDIVWQRFVPSPGWEILGDGAVAHRAHGKGHIWLVQARLIQQLHLPRCAQALRTLLAMGGKKPVVYIDGGSEGGSMTSSVYPDFMNAHDIPFLTLGEVIAERQGALSLRPIPGPLSEDAVLDGKGGAMVKALVENKVKAAASRPALPAGPDWEAERARRKREHMQSLGLDPLPERTPLNARITGTLQFPGYRLEKLVFESRPDFPVTAHLYVPEGHAGARLPVIVNPHGHWAHKKSEPVVQSRAIAQALAGYLALVVDSPGQSFEGDARIERRYAGTHFDPALILGSTNATAVYVWDLMRALDYLATRPEADMTRVGITGTSGGGLATVYAFAADERFTCAVPVCYATSLEVNPHNGCQCNHVPGTLRVGDRADILAIRAPAPVLVLGAQRDNEFPPEGTRKTGEKLRRQWALLGHEDAAQWRLFDSGHDYNQAMREAAVGFFDLHLRQKGNGAPVPEPKVTTLAAEAPELFCLPQPPAGLRTMRSIASEVLARAQPRSFAEVVAHNGGLPAATAPVLEVLGELPGRRQLVRLQSEPGLTIPGILHLPEGSAREGIVVVSEGGKQAAPSQWPLAEWLAAGRAVLCIDVRGTGELKGLDERLMTYLGTAPTFAMGFDAAQAARALRGRVPVVHVAGRGLVAAQAAVFAGLLEPGLASVTLRDELADLAQAFTRDVPWLALHPGADRSAPLSHLYALLGPRLQRAR